MQSPSLAPDLDHTEAEEDTGRRRPVVLAVSVAAVVALLAMAGVAAYGHWQAPLAPAAYGGPAPGSFGLLHPSADGDELTLDGPGGVRFDWVTGLANHGRLPVVVDGPGAGDAVVSAKWSAYDLRPGGPITGDPLPLHDFPATIRPGKQIRVVVTLAQPTCSDEPSGVRVTDWRVDWHALGQHRETRLRLDPRTIVLCGSR